MTETYIYNLAAIFLTQIIFHFTGEEKGWQIQCCDRKVDNIWWRWDMTRFSSAPSYNTKIVHNSSLVVCDAIVTFIFKFFFPLTSVGLVSGFTWFDFSNMTIRIAFSMNITCTSLINWHDDALQNLALNPQIMLLVVNVVNTES